MTNPTPSIEFFSGVSEELSNVRLRRNKNTGVRGVLMIFEKLKALERFNSFRKESTGDLRLIDAEGEISVAPSGVRFIFGGDEGDELQRVECDFEIERDDHWQRFMRFMNRYAEANGMEYSDKK
ncbi:photosystem II reaction center protein Psb28 [Lusitaniella coriacea LEGE 07157]|uniref:Photosystem II reaction center Psb28 protein n=1 Tax=Lusitaniella coriacea LEGE 07157 TaxID=945747 RepID=A0A8J7DW82_9CYAN|nr:photosystem II reaction center protein Psb28 [Lusitaniella coriacea]MBE9116204.1 photosystem II reaction center protein Psb28 [Lusitaniella coriacea LEGE 07157]